jgi:chemotaxis protein MotB
LAFIKTHAERFGVISMSADEIRPIIIKRKKVSGGDGHHGGAWKVAYADFVTAMMAFFMLMWLLNATTEQQKKGLADYFTPTIAIARVSGGGDGAFGGNNMFTEDVGPQDGTGGLIELPPVDFEEERESSNNAGELEDLEELVAGLIGSGGESLISENAKKHINTRLTDKGLVIELFDIDGDPLFQPDTAIPEDILRELSGVMAELFQLVENRVTIAAHSRTFPKVMARNPAWSLSTDRSHVQRDLLVSAGLPEGRIEQIIGFGQQKPNTSDPMAAENNRLEITLLRQEDT